MYPSIRPSIHPSIHPSFHPSINPFFSFLSLCPPPPLSLPPSLSPSLPPFFFHRTPVLKQFSQMQLQPKDLISTLPKIHEQTVSQQLPKQTPASFASPTDFNSPLSPGAKKGKKREMNLISTQAVDISDNYARSRAKTLRRNHYKPIPNAAKCASFTCRRRFGLGVRKRNCCRCGEVFCRNCTKFQRKLSQNAEPDPLGSAHPVCEKCFNFVACSGRFRSRMHIFEEYRGVVRRNRMERQSIDFVKPLPQRQRSETKLEQVRLEIDRLLKGFQTDSGNFKVPVKVPVWHKSAQWEIDSKQSDCFECKKKFKMTNRKINCRICGQVFCSSCTKNEILLYCFSDKVAKWAINGKEGCPTSKPSRFETLHVCNHCSRELESILLAELQGPTEEEYNFLEETVALQKELMSQQTMIETHLANYRKLVDSMDIEDESPRSISSQHPLHVLAKAQADLSDAFSFMANKSQTLKKLRPETEMQVKLIQHLMKATFEFYSEQIFIFRVTQLHLKEMIPIDSLAVIQRYLDQQSMERVHLLLQQIMFELINLQKKYAFDDNFFPHLVHVDSCVEEEFKPFLEAQGETWEEHVRAVRDFVKVEIVERPRITIKKLPQRKQRNAKQYVRYVAISQATSLLADCDRELEAKTRNGIFPKTKASLDSANKHLEEELRLVTAHF